MEDSVFEYSCDYRKAFNMKRVINFLMFYGKNFSIGCVIAFFIFHFNRKSCDIYFSN